MTTLRICQRAGWMSRIEGDVIVCIQSRILERVRIGIGSVIGAGGAEPINLGSGREVTIRDLTELIAELSNFTGRIVL